MARLVIFFLAVLLLPIESQGRDTIYFSLGYGANEKQKDLKAYSVGYERELEDPSWLLERSEVLYYTLGKGLIVTRSYGPRIKFWGLTMSITAGIGLNTKNAPRVSSGLQFTEQFRVQKGIFSIDYRHFSNAGIKKPNLGLDTINFSLNVDF